MAMAMTAVAATAVPAPQAADEELYNSLLDLQDAVISGHHPVIKLPAQAIAQLKASLGVPGANTNLSAYAANQQQLQAAAPVVNGLPGLNGNYGRQQASGGLDPIFLEKSDSLVRAERQLKRQRLEREIEAQVTQRKHAARGGDPSIEAPSRINVDEVLNAALILVTPVSGLKPDPARSVSSFDENDYYSSQAPDDWSSSSSPSKGSDKGTGAFTADFERLDGNRTKPIPSFAESSASAQKRALVGSALPPSASAKTRPSIQTNELENVYTVDDDEDDEYTPPDAAAFDSFREHPSAVEVQQVTPPDDDSDYEPGEITQESNVPTPQQPQTHVAQTSPGVPVIRNHLTHIAAPQPNRVSPLATAKGPTYELELVNGRPEVVQKQKPKPQQRSYPIQSRASTASPSGNDAGAGANLSKKQRKKKRKLQNLSVDNRPAKRGRRDRQHPRPLSPSQQDTYIKDEPVSPPPFSATNVPEYAPSSQYRPPPAQIDLSSPVQPPRQVQYVPEPSRSTLRYEYAPPAPQTVPRVASPAAYRPVQRDTQDLRRVASLHHAQRAPSPQERMYSPAPYRAASTIYDGSRSLHQIPPEAPEAPHYVPVNGQPQYVRPVADRSPPRLQEYDPNYSRAQSPAVMAAPPPSTRVLQDQYGRRYLVAESAPAPSAARASVAPVERQPEPIYERAPSRMATTYAKPPAPAPYEPAGTSMAPLSFPAKRQEQQLQYIDANGYIIPDQNGRSAQPPPARYQEEPTSPVYQAPRARYETMPPPGAARESTAPAYQYVSRYEPSMAPPPAPARQEAKSPVYQPVPRAYSVRPEEPPQPAPGYLRQASVAPVQYVRQAEMAPPPAPARAVSVMPGVGATDYNYQPQPQQTYGYASGTPPSQVKYVDQYGNEVYPQQIRQVYQ
jgi:hypothetical protein